MNRIDMQAGLADVLIDVSIREGSQQSNDLRNASVNTKLELLEHLVATGVKRIELTAFAPGEWFSDSNELVKGALSRVPDNITLRALYFSTRGLDSMLRHPRLGREGIFHTALTTNYREKNYRQRSPEHVEEKMRRLITSFRAHKLRFDTLLLSTAWGEQGEKVSAEQAVAYLGRLLASAQDQGFPIHSVTLADTAGCAPPKSIQNLVERVKRVWPEVLVRAHLHPDPENAADCIHAGLDGGIEQWEAAWGGLGGSPLATEPGGNIDIRWLIKVFGERRLSHGFNIEEIHRTIHFLRKNTEREIPDIQM